MLNTLKSVYCSSRDEVIVRNIFQDYRNVWDGPANGPLNSLRYHKRFMSRSTQHIRETVNEEEIPNDGYQSLPHRRNHHISSERGSSDLFASLPQLADDLGRHNRRKLLKNTWESIKSSGGNYRKLPVSRKSRLLFFFLSYESDFE